MKVRRWITRLARIAACSLIPCSLHVPAGDARAGAVDGVPVCTAAGVQYVRIAAAQPASLASGAFVVVWSDRRDPLVGFTLRASVIAPGLSSLVLPVDGVSLSDLPGSQDDVQAAAVGTSTVTPLGAPTVVAYTDQRVRIRRLFDGVTDWDVAPTEPALSSSEPRIVSDGGTGAWVAWRGPVVGDGAIWVQHLLEDGTGALGDAGRKLAGASPQYDLRAASDGAGGMFLSWSSFTPATYSLYIQHLTAAGAVAPGWPHQGRFVVTPDEAAYSGRPVPTLLADGLGGTYLLWEEYERGRALALHLLADGSRAPGWPADGALVIDRAGLARIEDATLDAGRHELAWDAGRASPGVRFLRMRTAAGERSVRFVTLR